MKFNWFIISLFLAILAAYLLPEALAAIPLKQITNVGIALIFFFYGLKLAPHDLKSGLFKYKAHLIIQLTTFLLFPLLSFLALPLFPEGTKSEFWLAIFFLCALPSTVSSSVVMVALAKGNLPVAIFNASISGLIGILVTPLWLGVFLAAQGDFEFLDIIGKLVLQILLPLILGFLLQRFLGKWFRQHSSKISLFDKFIIVLIVYSSFSESFASGLFTSVSIEDLMKIATIVLVLFYMVYKLLDLICKKLNFSVEDRISIKFCGTKKSLVHGSVMVKIIFGNSAFMGLYLLPIMLYHTLQLVVISYFADKYVQRKIPATDIPHI